MRLLFVFTIFLLLHGCAVNPPPNMSHLSTPNNPNKSGVYFYQWKTGILGSMYNVSLYINDEKMGSINTGEYIYFEIDPGIHIYDINAGQLFKNNVEFEAEKGNNYFFRGVLSFASATAYLVNDEKEITEAYENIISGRYKKMN